jgi:hypothetical protein
MPLFGHQEPSKPTTMPFIPSLSSRYNNAMTTPASLASLNTTDSLSSFELDDLEKEILAAMPPLNKYFCCCCLLDSTLAPNEHSNNCALVLASSDSGSADPNEDTHEPRDVSQKRKHRECVARIREKMRPSIASLKIQESELSMSLRRTIASAHKGTFAADPHTDAKNSLRHAYIALVREQIELEDEQIQLYTTQALREKYQRLADRELERACIFRVD